MSYTAEEKGLVWLCSLSGFEPRERIALLRAAKDPALLLRDLEKIAPSVIREERKGVYNGRGPERRLEETERFLDEMDEKGQFALFPMSEDFPKSLSAADPPLVLFGRGNRALLKERRFCIVGSRNTPPWAVKAGEKIARRLAEKFVIVTGLAEGGDRAAIDGALPTGRIISVLPCGLDECYPAAHFGVKEEIARKGLLLSEVPPKEKAAKYSFHARNRILAGLSEGVLLLSAGARSGALITADFALEYGRDVFAIPYNPNVAQGVGCNELIKRGACLTTDEGDILREFGMELPPVGEEKLTPDESRVINLLRESGELHAATLAEKLGKQIYEIAALLASLELKGLVVKSGGNMFGAT